MTSYIDTFSNGITYIEGVRYMLENTLIAMKPKFPHNHISDFKNAIQNFFLSKEPGTKNQVPFEKGDIDLSMEPYTHFLRRL